MGDSTEGIPGGGVADPARGDRTHPPPARRNLSTRRQWGHGLYSVEFCRTTPELEATVFDTPAAESVVRETVADEGNSDCIAFVGGDSLTDNLPDGDIALVFNVIHSPGSGENTGLFERIRTALTPGGRVVVMDPFDEDSWFPPVETVLRSVALTYLATLGGRAYPAADVGSWLRKPASATSTGPTSGERRA